jgi:hypothetical protein
MPPGFARQIEDPQAGPWREFEILLTISCLAVDGAMASVTRHFGTRCYRGQQFVRASGRAFDVNLFPA